MLGILASMMLDPIAVPSALLDLRHRVDETLDAFLRDVRTEIAVTAADALLPVDEVIRVVTAGGKRLRPAFCYWGFRAAGGPDGKPILRAAAALELLHTMALIHDDLMDDTDERRGVPASHVRLAAEARRLGATDPERVGRSLAILTGDLAAVLADRLLLRTGFEADVLVRALDRYHRMRTDMASGQCLDVVGGTADPAVVAELKGGTYTVVGPLQIGAALAGGDATAMTILEAYGAPLGLAFQLLDDQRDGDAELPPGRIAELVERSRAALVGRGIDRDARDALLVMADLVERG